jgi:hypothetical protein
MVLRPRAMPTFQFQRLNPAFQSDPRRILGQQLMGQGASTAPVRTPLQGLGRLSSALVGAYLQRNALDAQVQREDAYRDSLTQALGGLDLGNVPGLQALSKVSPELALQTGVNLEGQLAVASAKRTPRNTVRDMTPEEVRASGRDPSLGVYQIDNMGKITPPSGSQVTGDISNRFDQINEVIRLSQKGDLTQAESLRLDLFSKDLARSRPVVVPDGAGGTMTIMQPGLDVSSITGGQTVTGDSAIPGDPTGQTGQPAPSAIPGGVVAGTKPDQLTTQEAEFVADAASAQADLQTVIDIMFNGDLTNGEYNSGVAIASGTAVGRGASGDAQRLFDALNNLVDLRLRSRTGATANQSEIDNYLGAVLPGITTREGTQRARVERLITELNAKITAFKAGRKISNLNTVAIPEVAANDTVGDITL